MEEQSILKDIVEGKLYAFEMIFKQYYKPLVAYSRTILKDHQEAEDVVQQVFITIWNKKNELLNVTSFRSYLYRSVYNASLNRIKQVGIRQQYAKEFSLNAKEAFEERSDQKELEIQIENAMRRLPEQCGKIFRMSRFEQLKYKEIADTLGLSVKTVENQMGKALKLMRESLADYLPVLIFFIANYLEQ